MLISTRKKIHSIFKGDRKNKLRYECVKICLIYLLISFIWVYFSDKISDKLISDRNLLLNISTYKGFIYVIITSVMLYLLITTLLKKVDLAEEKLSKSYEELSQVNEELKAYVEQLTASEKELRTQEEKNRAIIKALPDLLFIVDNNGYFIDCMASDENLLLIPQKDFIGKSIKEVLPEEVSQKFYKKMQSVLEYGLLEKFEYKLLISHKEQYFELRMIRSNENEILAISRNVTIERQNEIKLKMSEERYRTLVSKMYQGLSLYEGSGNADEKFTNYRLLDANRSYEKLIGLKRKDILGKTVLEIFPQIDKSYIEKLEHVKETGETIYYENYIKEKDKYHQVVAYRPKKSQIAIIVNDITKRKCMEKEMEYLSYRDQLTGLYNRRFFEEELRRLDAQGNLPFTIVMGDVNGLKLVNDSFGHAMGDELLKKVAEVIRKGCRKEDIIARLGGDEFVILLPKTDIYGTEQIIKRIKSRALKEKVGAVDISISFGYETKKDKEIKASEVLKKAEDYMYKKKLFEGPSMRGKTIDAIITTLHEKNKREEEHSHRVSILCGRMGQALELHEDEIKELEVTGLLHDIGKIAIEENILNKCGKLTDDEWKEIKRHPEIGYRILNTVDDMSEIAEYVLAHHERWDGTGYPKGLKGEEIPLQSRIITIIDSYDAMISERNYREALSEEVALKELKANMGTQFDSQLVRVFIEKVLKRSFDEV